MPSAVSLRMFSQRLGTVAERAASQGEQAAKVIRALRTKGYLSVPIADLSHAGRGGHEIVAHAYNQATFFDLKPEVKERFTEERCRERGCYGSCYAPPGREPAYQANETQRVESFSCTKSLTFEQFKHLRDGSHKFHRNSFPSQEELLPEFGPALEAFFNAAENRVTLPALAAVELGLGLQPGFLVNKCLGRNSMNMTLLRLMQYAPLEEGARAKAAEKVVGISEHTDFEAVTVIHQNVPGLWIWEPARQQWTEIPQNPDELTLMVGDMLEILTNGFLRATRHRVAPPTGDRARQSLVLFQALDDDEFVAPIHAPGQPWGPALPPGVPRRKTNDQPIRRRAGAAEAAAPDAFMDADDTAAAFRDYLSARPPDLVTYPLSTQREWIEGMEGAEKQWLLGPPEWVHMGAA